MLSLRHSTMVPLEIYPFIAFIRSWGREEEIEHLIQKF